MKSNEITIKSDFDLVATMTMPNMNKNRYPGLVIIGGTGTLNRDGNGLGFKMNIYKQVTEMMSDLGFVTLRYDKRGVGKSKGKPSNTGLMDAVNDVKAAVNYLREQSFVDSEKIVLLGHSEGCILSMLVAEQIDVSGLLLISGAGVSIKTSMEEQARGLLDEVEHTSGFKGFMLRMLVNEKNVVGKQNKLFEKVSTSQEDTIRVQLMKFPAKWLREHLQFTDQDFLDKLKEQSIPILAVTGDKDVQTDYHNLNRISDLGNDQIQVSVIENMDHMLRKFEGKMTIIDIKKQYKQEMKQPLHNGLKNLIEEWVEKHGYVK